METEEIKNELYEDKLAQINNLNEYVTNIGENISTVNQVSEKMQRVAGMLGLKWNTGISQDNLINMFNEIRKNSIDVSTCIASIENDKLDSEVHNFNGYKENVNFIKEINIKISAATQGYSATNCKEELTEELSRKVNSLVKQAYVQSIDKQLGVLESKKVGVFGRILGKNKEVELEKQYIGLQKKLLEMEPEEVEDKDANSIAATILTYKEQHNGKLTAPLQEVLHKMGNVFEIDDKKVKELISERTKQKALVPLKNNKSIFKNKKIARLSVVNNELEQRLEYLKLNSVRQSKNQSSNSIRPSGIPQIVYGFMENIEKVFETNQSGIGVNSKNN